MCSHVLMQQRSLGRERVEVAKVGVAKDDAAVVVKEVHVHR
jgi:hypothetical protein